MKTKTAWQDTRLPRFKKVNRSARFDVIIIGGGITGLTAAYLLKKAGKKVCLLERQRLAAGDTGCTTAHLTYVTDLRPADLVRNFGRDAASLVWQGGATAIQTIEEIVNAEKIDCDFQRVPGFLHAPLESGQNGKEEARRLEADCRIARELGFGASFLSSVPFVKKPGVCFANQAKFHPLKYLAGVARAIPGAGSAIFENSEVSEVEDGSLAVKVNGKKIGCRFLIIATHVPLMGKTGLVSASLFQTKLAPYSSYAIGAKLPKGAAPVASFWDTSDPYFYLRVDSQPRTDYAIFGGADHKTGQVDNTVERFARLERVLKKLLPEAKVNARWSGQVIETNDGLPFIGETAENQFVATGFAGNGMTFGTLAAMMARDAALGRKNPWQQLFDVNRKPIRGGIWDFIKENLDYPYYFLRDSLLGGETGSPDSIQRGQGKVLKIKGQSVACSRDDGGKLSTVSATCTHLGCTVHWNAAEKTWDCPCHGSRFQATGDVLAGPAESPLQSVALQKLKEESAPHPSHSRKPRKQKAGAEESTGRKIAASRPNGRNERSRRRHSAASQTGR